MLSKRALILSPFATTPDDAGQRRRVRQVTRFLKDQGFAVTFLLYAFEDGWKARANENWLAEMRREWDEVIVWRAGPKVGVPATSGFLHTVDEWWDEKLEVLLEQTFRYRYFDVFVVNNVWLSKAFDFAPRSTIRVLDVHDVFSMRREYFERSRIEPEFFLPDHAGEVHGINRSDVVLGIQQGDTDWLSQHTASHAICVPYFSPPRAQGVWEQDYLHPNKVVFGFLGSNHIFNVQGLTQYCQELKQLVGRTAAPVELRIGGRICQSITTKGPWVLQGYVDDEAKFLKDIDIAVVPVFNGSGFKIKVADAIAHSKPLIAASHAALGVNLDRHLLAERPIELAQLTTEIALHRPAFRSLRDAAQKACVDLDARARRGGLRLLRHVESWPRTMVYDLTDLSANQARTVLLSWCGSFHVVRTRARQLVLASDEICHEFGDLGPPGVNFATEADIRDRAKQVFRWVTIANRTPRELHAKPENITVDSLWADALGLSGNRQADENVIAKAPPLFWHSIKWDQLALRAAQQGHEKSEQSKDTVLVFDTVRRNAVSGALAELYGTDFDILDSDDIEEFRALITRMARGKLRRVVMVDPRRTSRARILRDLAATTGIEFCGALDAGGFWDGVFPKETVNGLWRQFEKHWHEIAIAEPLQ